MEFAVNWRGLARRAPNRCSLNSMAFPALLRTFTKILGRFLFRLSLFPPGYQSILVSHDLPLISLHDENTVPCAAATLQKSCST